MNLTATLAYYCKSPFARLSVALLVLCFCVTALALPIGNPTKNEVKPLKITFEQLEPDWWTNWENLKPTEKTVFLASIQSLFEEHVKLFEQDITWNTVRPEVDAQLEALNNLMQASAPLEAIPPIENKTLNIMEWLKLYELHLKKASMLTAQSKETETLYNEVKSSLETLRNSVIAYRNESDELLKRQLGAQLFLAQLKHLTRVEALSKSKMRLAAMQTQIAKLKQVQEYYTNKIVYSDKVQEQLQSARKKLEQEQKKLDAAEKKLEKSLKAQKKKAKDKLSTNQLLSFDLDRLKLSAEQLKIDIEFDKNDLLININFVLNEPDIIIENQWPKIIEAKELRFKELNEQANFIRLQLLSVSYEEEQSKTHNKLWQKFELIQRQFLDTQKQLQDASFYRKTLGEIYVDKRGWLALFQSKWGQWRENIEVTWKDIINYPLVTINESPVTPLDFINVILIILIAIFFSFSIRRTLSRLVDKYDVSESTTFTVGRILHYTIITTAVLVSLGSLGLDFSKIALVAGALSVGIGFGLQSIFNNFVSGLILLFERPLKVGDIVELESGVKGHIRAINVRSTRVTTRDNIDILVPNSEFVNGRVTNYTFADPMRRIHIRFKVALDSDKEKVREAGLLAANRVKFTSQAKGKKPDVWLMNFGDSALEFALVVWVNSHRSPNDNFLFAQYNWEIDTALRDAGIEIPVPYQKVFIEKLPDPVGGTQALGNDKQDLLAADNEPESDSPSVKSLEQAKNSDNASSEQSDPAPPNQTKQQQA